MSAVADRFVNLVSDCTERIIVAGSIRRQQPFPNDVDIVAIPKPPLIPSGIWVDTSGLDNLLHARIDRLLKDGVVSARPKTDGKTTMVGGRVAMLMFEEVPLDVYYATEETWWGLVQMRTGSAAFNTMLATRALKMGLRFNADGHGITRDGKRIDDGKSEEAIFKALDYKYLKPEDRD